MKNFWLLLSLVIFSLLCWLFSSSLIFDSSKYFSKEVLAKSTPINVRIDVDLLKSLSPAYEQ